jgi:hypothetical protein
MRVNGSANYLPPDGREVLVLEASGKLSVARVVGAGVHERAEVRAVDDAELVSEDLAPFVGVVQEALERHIALSDRRVQSLEKVEELAAKVTSAIGIQTIR